MHYHNNSATGIRIIPNYSFPFQDLENDEFLKTIGSWVYNWEDRLSGKVDLDRDIYLFHQTKMTLLSALMIITLNLTIIQLKSLAKYLMTLVNKKGFRYSTVIFVVWEKTNPCCMIF